MDTLDLQNLSNRTKIILTNILNNFLEKYKNDDRYSQQILDQSNKLLKTQLFIIFDDPKLFSKSMNYINIPNPKLSKYLYNIRLFFENNNPEKKVKGINFIINKSGLNNKYIDVLPLLNNYETLYDNIRYNEKVINFIYQTFNEEIKSEIENIVNSLKEFNDLYISFNIDKIQNKIKTIKEFYTTNDKEIFIMSQKSLIENKITYFLTNLTNLENQSEVDFNFDEFKPNDISIMANDNINAEHIWQELINEQKKVILDRDPNNYFLHFLELFNYLKQTELKFMINTENIKILITEIENYNKFLQKQTSIFANIPYYDDDNNDNFDNDDNFINFLQNIPESDKKLLNQIQNMISNIISNLFTNINSNYNTGFEILSQTDYFNTIENDLSKIQYYDKKFDKQRISYNVLFNYANKCIEILAYKNNTQQYQSILPIGIYPSSFYKYDTQNYLYILIKIFDYITKIFKNPTIIDSCIYETCKEGMIMIISYYKIIRKLKGIITKLSIENTDLDKLFENNYLQFENMQNYLENKVKSTSVMSDLIQNIIYNMDDYNIPTRNNALNKKIKQKQVKNMYKEFISNCNQKQIEKLRKAYFKKKPSTNILVKKLITNEKNNDEEWNIIINHNYHLFIAYFSNMFHKIQVDFSDGNNQLYSFEYFNKTNQCTYQQENKYISCYEKNFNRWIAEISNLLPLPDYINRYINVYEQYIEKNLYKIVDNRIILGNTKDEIKYYKKLKTKKQQKEFLVLILEKQNVLSLTTKVSSYFSFYTKEKNFYDNLFNICLSNENIFNLISKHIAQVEVEITKEEEDITFLKILAEELGSDEMLDSIKNRENLIEIKKQFFKIVVSKKFEDKFERQELDTNDELLVELNKVELNIKEIEEEDIFYKDDDEELYEYGETEEPDEINYHKINTPEYEFNDFEQQTQINIQDILDKRDKNKNDLLKQWSNTLSNYLETSEKDKIMTKVLNLINNIEYKNSNQKKIHDNFAKFLKNPYLSTHTFNNVKKLKFDKKLRKMHYEFLTQVEYDVFRLLLIFYTIIYNLDNIVKQKISICSTKKIKSFIKDQYISIKTTTHLSNFVSILSGKWKGYTATVVSNNNKDYIIESKKKIINNLKSCILYYKKLRKTFVEQDWLSNFKKLGNTNTINKRKNENQKEFIKKKTEQMTKDIDESIANIKKKLIEKITEFKNNDIYVTIDRYGINGNKYVPHIKQIKLKLKDVEFSKVSQSGLNTSITNKFEEVKEQFSGSKTLANYTKCLYYILEIFHNPSSKMDFQEIFEKNYFLYIYNFAFEIFEKNRALEKRTLLIQLDNEYDINKLNYRLNSGSLSNVAKRRLQKQIAIAETKQQIVNIEDTYSHMFETYEDKKPRKDTITLFKNLYVNKKGNILLEHEISVMKQLEKVKNSKKDKLIKKLNNQFDSFYDNIENAYKNEECNILKILQQM